MHQMLRNVKRWRLLSKDCDFFSLPLPGRSKQTSFLPVSPGCGCVTQTLNEPPSPATLVMDTNPWLTYLILLSPLPVAFLSASPHRAVIRHVGKKDVYFPIASVCATRDGGYTCRVLFVPPRHQRMVAMSLLLAARRLVGSESVNTRGASCACEHGGSDLFFFFLQGLDPSHAAGVSFLGVYHINLSPPLNHSTPSYLPLLRQLPPHHPS